MIQKLQEFNFTIVDRPGNKHVNADGLSRREEDIPEWQKEAKEALRGQTPEVLPLELALEESERKLANTCNVVRTRDANHQGGYLTSQIGRILDCQGAVALCVPPDL